mgnify:FL=1
MCYNKEKGGDEMLKKVVRRIILLILMIAAVTGGAVVVNGYEIYKDAVGKVPVSDKIAQIQEKEHYTKFDQLPQRYIDAVIAAEDRRFFKHHGFDILATGRAMWHNMEAGSLIEGGSTITQQLAKNMYFSQEKKFTRKVAEVFVSNDIENLCDKETIFELYINSIYFGSGYYTVYDAAHGYYGKDPADLNDYECTMLAGVPNAPSVYSPDVNPKLAEERRQQVLECMVENGYIEEGELQ